MNLSTQFKIKNNPLLQKYIRENSYWYKYLNRNPNLLTEMEKEKIEALSLPGIDFIEDEKRYYPNGDFASYTIGYAKKMKMVL